MESITEEAIEAEAAALMARLEELRRLRQKNQGSTSAGKPQGVRPFSSYVPPRADSSSARAKLVYGAPPTKLPQRPVSMFAKRPASDHRPVTTGSRRGGAASSAVQASHSSITLSYCPTEPAIQALPRPRGVAASFPGIEYMDAHASASRKAAHVVVEQLVSGGNTVVVFNGRVAPGELITFSSQRKLSAPLSFKLFKNGLLVERWSSCCEARLRPGHKISGASGSFKVLSVHHLTPCLQCRVVARRDGREHAPARDGSPPASDEGVSDSALCDADERVEEDTGTDPHPLDGDVGRAGQALSSTMPAHGSAPAPPSLESSARLLLTKLDHLRSRLETREAQRGFPSVRWRAHRSNEEDNEESIEEIRSRAFPTIKPVSLPRPATAAARLDSMAAQHDASASEPIRDSQTVTPPQALRGLEHDGAQPASQPSAVGPLAPVSRELSATEQQTDAPRDSAPIPTSAGVGHAANVESPKDSAPARSVPAAAAAVTGKPETESESAELPRGSSASTRPKLVLTSPSLSSTTLKSRESVSALPHVESSTNTPQVQAIYEENEATPARAVASATAAPPAASRDSAISAAPAAAQTTQVPGDGVAASCSTSQATPAPLLKSTAAPAAPAPAPTPTPTSASSAVSGLTREQPSRPMPAAAPSAHPPVMPVRPPPLSMPRPPSGPVSAGPLTPAIMSRPASAARALLPGASAESGQSADVVLAAMQILSSLPALKRPGSSVGPHPVRPASAALAANTATNASTPMQPALHAPASVPAPAPPSMARPVSARPPSGSIRASASQGLQAARSTESVAEEEADGGSASELDVNEIFESDNEENEKHDESGDTEALMHTTEMAGPPPLQSRASSSAFKQFSSAAPKPTSTTSPPSVPEAPEPRQAVEHSAKKDEVEHAFGDDDGPPPLAVRSSTVRVAAAAPSSPPPLAKRSSTLAAPANSAVVGSEELDDQDDDEDAPPPLVLRGTSHHSVVMHE